jgi:hypothetical protein
MPSNREVYAQFFEQESNEVLNLVQNIDPSIFCKQLAKDKAHPLWLFGHILGANDTMIHIFCCGGENLLPKEWGTKFSPDFIWDDLPRPDADFYPTWEEITEQFKVVSAACAEGIRNLSDEALNSQLGENFPEMLREYFKTVDNTLRVVIQHSAYHRGQLSALQLSE